MGSLLEPCDPIGVPRVGDVIVCEAFANGWQQCSEPGVPIDAPIWVTDAQELPKLLGDYRRDCRDASRAQAAYVVEDVRYSESTLSWTKTRSSGYGGEFQTEDRIEHRAKCVVARRLGADGSYDPEGECVRFELWGNGSNDSFCEAARRIRADAQHAYRNHSILEAPIYKTRTMQRIVRFV